MNVHITFPIIFTKHLKIYIKQLSENSPQRSQRA